MKTKVNIQDLAHETGHDLISTTAGSNGYPKNVGYAIGPDNFEGFQEMEEFADKYGLRLRILQRQDGQDLWYRSGSPAIEPIKLSAEDFGDNYNEIEDESSLIEELNARFFYEETPITSIEELENISNAARELKEELETLGEDESLAVQFHYVDGKFIDVDWETFKPETLSHYHDTRHFTIAITE